MTTSDNKRLLLHIEKFTSPQAAFTDVSQQYDYFWKPPPWTITDPQNHIVEGYASMPNLDDQGAVEKKTGPGKVRPDTNPQQGVRDYGDVDFADEANKKYPIDTEAHIRRGWNYINMPKNQRFYTPEAVKRIKNKIIAAW